MLFNLWTPLTPARRAGVKGVLYVVDKADFIYERTCLLPVDSIASSYRLRNSLKLKSAKGIKQRASSPFTLPGTESAFEVFSVDGEDTVEIKQAPPPSSTGPVIPVAAASEGSPAEMALKCRTQMVIPDGSPSVRTSLAAPLFQSGISHPSPPGWTLPF